MSTITEMSPEMAQLFQMMKTELHQQTATITNAVTESIIHKIDEKLQTIVEENKYLKNEVQRLVQKVKYLDGQNRKNNLVLHGIKETENNPQELFDLIKETINFLDIDINIYETNSYKRIGKRQGGNKIRPILVSFTSFQKKLKILKNKTKMPKPTYITEDFSKETMEMRKNLQEKLKEEKLNGKDAFILNNKIIIKDTTDAEKRKREASISPNNTNVYSPTGGSNNVSAPPKLHKTNAFEYMRARSVSSTAKPPQKHNA
ncbi:uncharacterized protein LOC111357251 [Spodoptera litura]|uniref:Uncharacterized protein LOC111357251 n=1 Tax=Spodoptera litura TaxID=69820 RepID=A0A9J7IUG8_SPOLT|nr:uncharacterized protein LOC111357251 [Spodoptera litura]